MNTLSTTLVNDRPAPMPIGRILAAYLREIRAEILQALRAPAFALPFLLLPAPLYFLFGVVIAGNTPGVDGKPAIANYLFAGWCTFAVMGPAIFGVGVGLATERDSGLLRLKRALPAPPGAHLVAKMAMSVAFAAAALVTVMGAALLAGKITLTAAQLATMFVVFSLGAIPFCALGLFLGAFASGSAAPAFGNLVYLPAIWLSGILLPLPKALEKWVVLWPSFHLDQVALGLAGVDEFSFVPPLISAVALLAVTIVFGGIAIRRVTRVG